MFSCRFRKVIGASAGILGLGSDGIGNCGKDHAGRILSRYMSAKVLRADGPLSFIALPARIHRDIALLQPTRDLKGAKRLTLLIFR